MTNTKWLRRRLLRGVDDRFLLERLRETEWSPRFEQRMRNRLIIGALRYGLIGDPEKPKWDRIGRAVKELTLYQTDHNKERLVDIANIMLLEFEEGDGHFSPSDDGEHTKERV